MKINATFEIQNNENLTKEEIEKKICEAFESLESDGLKAIEWNVQ